MGNELLRQLLPAIEKMSFTGAEAATPAGQIAFEVGRDRVDAFRGDPRTLADALRTFQTADSLPYEYTGVALVVLAASREADGSYAPAGLETALNWLEKAQELAPDVTDINVVEGFIYIFGGRLDDARLVLDYLHEQDGRHYYIARAEAAYWRSRGDLQQTLQWCEQAIQTAATLPQRLRVRSIMADIYEQMGDGEAALRNYREAIYFDPNNAWLWHRVALLQWRAGAVEEARHANEKALQLDPVLAEAQQLQQTMNTEGGILGRIFKG